MDWLFIIYTVSLAIQTGLFFIFSNTIMKVLKSYKIHEGREVMVRINKEIQNPLFLTIFLSPLIIIIVSILFHPSLLDKWIIISFTTYFIGSFLVTIFFNVPMNRRLDINKNMEYWSHYLGQWTLWNHVRTISSVLALIAMILKETPLM